MDEPAPEAVPIVAMEEPVPPVTTPEKCSYRSCKVTGALLIACSAAGCSKKVHLMCFHGLLLRKHPALQELPVGKVACTKRCHAKIIKDTAGGGDDADGGNRKGNWDCDGLNGVEDPHTSVKILLDWWMAEGNYNKFCGKNNNGIKKKQVCTQLAEKISRETKTQRNAKNVQSKIQHIEKTFKDAYIFATSETGAGLKENDEGTFDDAVKKKCPYYFDLLDIMADRASSKPKATSYDDSDESEVIELQAFSELSDEEVCDEVGDEVVEELVTDKSVTSKRTARTNSSRKGKKKKKPSIVDDEGVAALTKASKFTKDRIDELVRHNQFIEKLEERKLKHTEFVENLEERKLALEEKRELRGSWKGRTDKLEYKMRLLERYNQLKKDYNWTDKRIIAFYPDMKEIVESTSDDWAPFTIIYL